MKSKYFFILSILVVILCSFINEAFAIAAWARKYGADCSMCHWGGWKLNKTGQDFLRYGHKMEDDSADDKSLSDFVSFNGKVRFKAENEAKKSTTFEQHAFTIYTGGALDQGFSYFTELYFHENSGKNPDDTTYAKGDFDDYGRSKLAEAYIMYTYGNKNTYSTIRFGQIVPYIIYIHGAGGRSTFSRPLAISIKIGNNPYQPRQRNYGIELSQRKSKFHLSAGVVNGTGSTPQNTVDNNSAKDLYGSIDFEFDENGSIVGVYGYKGEYPLAGFDDKFSQYGGMFNYLHQRFAVTGLVLLGSNDKNIAMEKQKSRLMYLELDLNFANAKYVPFIRYDYVDTDTGIDNTEKHGPVFGISWSVTNYGRIVGEYKSIVDESTSKSPDSFTLEAQYMF